MERGVRITRIFVLRRPDLADATAQRVLESQLASGIDVRVAFVEELSMHACPGSTCPAQASYDFAVYDGGVVTERVGPGGGHFGRKTQRTTEVARYQRLFEIIAHNAHPVVLQEGHIVPADLAAEKEIAARHPISRAA